MTRITDRLRIEGPDYRGRFNFEVRLGDGAPFDFYLYPKEAAALVAALTPTPARTTTDEDDLTRRGSSGSQPPRSAASTDAKGSELFCYWHIDDIGGDSQWETACGHAFEFTDDGPDANGFVFCGYCGKSLIETRTSDDADDEGATADALLTPHAKGKAIGSAINRSSSSLPAVPGPQEAETCPTCGSSQREAHPLVGDGSDDVRICHHLWHRRPSTDARAEGPTTDEEPAVLGAGCGVTAPPIFGTWAADDPRRIFVAGAAWWQFHKNGATVFSSERDEMEAEATRRFPVPPAAPGAEDATIRCAEHPDEWLYLACEKCIESGWEERERDASPAPAAGSAETFALSRKQAAYVLGQLQAHSTSDHGCRQCVGENVMVIEGMADFVCVRHQLAAWLSSPPSSSVLPSERTEEQ